MFNASCVGNTSHAGLFERATKVARKNALFPWHFANLDSPPGGGDRSLDFASCGLGRVVYEWPFG